MVDVQSMLFFGTSTDTGCDSNNLVDSRPQQSSAICLFYRPENKGSERRRFVSNWMLSLWSTPLYTGFLDH